MLIEIMGWFTLAGKLANQRIFNAKDKMKSFLSLLRKIVQRSKQFYTLFYNQDFPDNYSAKTYISVFIMFIIFHDENTQLYLLKYAHFVPTIKLSTTSVPRGKVRAPLWTHPLIQYLNILPIKLPTPIINHNGIYSPLS